MAETEPAQEAEPAPGRATATDERRPANVMASITFTPAEKQLMRQASAKRPQTELYIEETYLIRTINQQTPRPRAIAI